jgi:hypothetical protein
VDDTAPSWLQEHPNSPRIYAVASGDFYAKIAVDGYFPDDPMQILPALVEAYNHSGNPGRFELRSMNHESFDIVIGIVWIFPGPGQSVHNPSIRSRRTASANARKSRSRVRRGMPPSMQLWAIRASPRRALRRLASTLARNSPARCQ